MWDRLFVRVFVLLFPEIEGDDVELCNYDEKNSATCGGTIIIAGQEDETDWFKDGFQIFFFGERE